MILQAPAAMKHSTGVCWDCDKKNYWHVFNKCKLLGHPAGDVFTPIAEVKQLRNSLINRDIAKTESFLQVIRQIKIHIGI